MQKVRTLSSNFSVRYTILLSYSSSVRWLNTTAGSSTRTPISTRLDSVPISSSRHTVSIHLLPLRPTDTTHWRHSQLSRSLLTR